MGKGIERASGSIGRMSNKYSANEKARQIITSGDKKSAKGRS